MSAKLVFNIHRGIMAIIGAHKGHRANVDVAIVGAGPYGLSIAAHLKARGIDFRIFGNPMRTWLEQMPAGMRLKSEGFASFLYDPDSVFTLADYCKERGLPYADTGLPVPLETFAAYGLEFQKRFVPDLEKKEVVSVSRSAEGFQIRLADGETLVARKVVVAAGIGEFGYLPPVLSTLPEEYVSHSSKYGTLEKFKGREVVVVGAGASALDVAALLHQAGASVQLVARKSVIRFHDPPTGKTRTLWQRIQMPVTGIGSGWRLVFCTEAPNVFRLLPERIRLEAVRKTLGPAPGWFIKDQVVGKVPLHLGVTILNASVENGRAKLELTDTTGAKREIETDHVIAATGYQVDLRRLTFLASQIVEDIRAVERTPVLSSNFESSVPGLYFVGTTAANSFGPLMRFAFGARFTAKRLSKHFARSATRNIVKGGSRAEIPTVKPAETPRSAESQHSNSKDRAGTLPNVLLTDTTRWPCAARLAVGLWKAGLNVSAVCPPVGHPLRKASVPRLMLPYDGRDPLDSLAAAIEATDPQIIIPCDDLGVRHLHELHARSRSNGNPTDKIAAVIERSLGSPESYPIVSARYKILQIAREEGLRVPNTSLINSTDDLKSRQEGETFPFVLKADGTWGGRGVRFADTGEQAEQFYLELTRPLGFVGLVKQVLMTRDRSWLRQQLGSPRPSIIAQSFIHGRPANCAVVCWEGKVLAGIGVEVVSTAGVKDPATVVRVVDNHEMMLFAEKIARRLGLSGFFGLDFMIEDRSNLLYLIEMNPRCTPLCHLQLGKGRDLIEALRGQLTGQPIREIPPMTEKDMIAYFPQAWTCESEFLQMSYQDIPQGEPGLVQELLHPWSERSVLGRIADRVRHRGPGRSLSYQVR
jgi:thioredoxin reductase